MPEAWLYLIPVSGTFSVRPATGAVALLPGEEKDEEAVASAVDLALGVEDKEQEALAGAAAMTPGVEDEEAVAVAEEVEPFFISPSC